MQAVHYAVLILDAVPRQVLALKDPPDKPGGNLDISSKQLETHLRSKRETVYASSHMLSIMSMHTDAKIMHM